MPSRSTTVTFSFPSGTGYAHRAAAVTRSTQPEFFTFDSEHHHPHPHPHHQEEQQRQRRRPKRVMYPAKVRRYLPPAEKSTAKRLLMALCLLLLAQIYTERGDDELHDARLPEEDAALAEPLSTVHGDPRALPPPLRAPADCVTSLADCATWMNGSVQHRHALQSAGNHGYVVALLYPVYHTLGTEQ